MSHEQTNKCNKTLFCGHNCNGFKDEITCLPCLDEKCQKPDSAVNLSTICVLCQSEPLGYGPCVKLTCGHIVHSDCLHNFIAAKKAGPTEPIVSSYLQCQVCFKFMTASENVPSKTLDIIKEGIKVKSLIKE